MAFIKRATLILLLSGLGFAQQLSADGKFHIRVSGSGNNYTITLTKNVPIVVFDVPFPGAIISIAFIQDNVGGHTVGFDPTILSTCAISTVANTTTNCQYYYDGGVNQWFTSFLGIGGGSSGSLSWPLAVQNFFPIASGSGANPNLSTSANLSESGSPPVVHSLRFENTRNTDQFIWAVLTPGGTLTAATQATVTLPSGPIGMDTTGQAKMGVGNTVGGAIYGGYMVRINDVTTPTLSEDVFVTGGTCPVTGTSSSCTIIITPINSHTGTWNIGPSTAGIQEAINDGCGISIPTFNNVGCHIIITPSPTPWTVTGRIFFHAFNSTLTGSGAILSCVSSPNGGYRGPCLQIGDQISSVDYRDDRVDDVTFFAPTDYSAQPAYNGCLISSTQRISGLITITTASSCGFQTGDAVTIMWTDNAAYWGDVPIITVTSPTTFTYPRAGVADITLATTPGVVALTYVPILDNALGTLFTGIHGMQPGSNGRFVNFFDFWDDEAAQIVGFNNDSRPMVQSANWYGSNLFSGGASNLADKNEQLAAVISMTGSNITAQDSGCGTFLNSNGVYIRDVVCQATGAYQWLAETATGNFQGANFENIYPESAIGSGNPASPARSPWPGTGIGGFICRPASGNCTYKGAFAPTSALQTAGSGGTALYYFLVVHDTTTSVQTAPFLIYQWNSTGSDAPIIPWPRWANNADTITYDLIRTGTNPLNTTNSVFPTTSGCTGGAGTACGSVSGGLGIAQCAGFVCTFTDSAAANTASYTIVNGTWNGILEFPGPLAYATNQTTLITDQEPTGTVAQFQMVGNPTYAALNCKNSFALGQSGGGYNLCLSTTANSLPTQAAFMLMDGATIGGTYASIVKGKLNFNGTTTAESAHHIITLIDSQGDVTRARETYRPTAAANDSFIGVDAGTTVNNAGISYGAPSSHSWYIANTGDNSSYKARITSALFTSTIPFNSPSYQTATKCAAVGTAASPSLVACGAAAAGQFSCATNASTATCVISTTAVTSTSTVTITPSAAYGGTLGVTCNTTADTPTGPRLASISNGVSFTINLGTITTNPECYGYTIIN